VLVVLSLLIAKGFIPSYPIAAIVIVGLFGSNFLILWLIHSNLEDAPSSGGRVRLFFLLSVVIFSIAGAVTIVSFVLILLCSWDFRLASPFYFSASCGPSFTAVAASRMLLKQMALPSDNASVNSTLTLDKAGRIVLPKPLRRTPIGPGRYAAI
jgi:hypothetical protein